LLDEDIPLAHRGMQGRIWRARKGADRNRRKMEAMRARMKEVRSERKAAKAGAKAAQADARATVAAHLAHETDEAISGESD
jgi:hypothetical protein